ncbi:M48 family metallopeptidase [Methanolobus bombayensis]|uniref:M48 metallopeptidase family protein n=1 Tax=Methanolobus bombayensis TaxID=38023 RepID=UPI001AE982E0|nr:M48 family metallopeptidase [Methanolobus bombayensis]MBP1907819.1 putative metal-dependent hydrolase [Methanolobus bombayensis]
MRCTVSIRDMVIDYELVRRDVRNPRLEFLEGELYLIVPRSFREHEKIIRKHQRWIYNRYSRLQKIQDLSQDIELVSHRSVDELKRIIQKYASEIEKELNVRPEKIRFREMKTKWGSCSSRGNLNFNTFMRYLPDEMIEYIVHHEMVHLIELNHSSRFWNYVKKRYPDYKESETKLAAYWSLIQQKYHTGHSL